MNTVDIPSGIAEGSLPADFANILPPPTGYALSSFSLSFLPPHPSLPIFSSDQSNQAPKSSSAPGPIGEHCHQN